VADRKLSALVRGRGLYLGGKLEYFPRMNTGKPIRAGFLRSDRR
jgi:hypothetical protein